MKRIFCLLIATLSIVFCQAGNYNIQDKAAHATNLFPSLWRNEVTGDWEIGFYEDFAIYDCHFWQYKQKNQKGDKYSFVLTDGKSDLAVFVGKNQKGKRMIKFGGKAHNSQGHKEAECSLITTKTLPDYPQKDTVTTFKDNHYQKMDTVTLVGWLKDMPEDIKLKGNEYSISIPDYFDYSEDFKVYGKIDSLGRFEVKMPMHNASEAYYDWSHTYINTLLEPGETYFLLYDFKTGCKMFMGNNCRLQNESLSYPPMGVRRVLGRGIPTDDHLASLTVDYENIQKQLEQIIAEHPTLSERYRLYCMGYNKCAYGWVLGQGKFEVKNLELTPKYLAKLAQLLQDYDKPYTFYKDFRVMLNDILQAYVSKKYTVKTGNIYFSLENLLYPRILKSHQQIGDIQITDAEIDKIEEWVKAYQAYVQEFVQETDSIKRIKLDEDYDKSKLKKEADDILKREDVAKMMEEESKLMLLYATVEVADSFHISPQLREIVITQQLYRFMFNYSLPLNDIALKYLKDHVTMEFARQYILAMHEKLLAIQNKDISKSTSLKAATSDIENTMEGEKLLRKIVEPYKGKIVLIDVWGTWCGPCKDALSHSKEEYKCLAPYDVVYLYLANNSSEDSWKNVIKQYDLVGDNIVHYNLPEAQQNAIENYLKVNSYPSYRLLDRNGNLLDIKVDARNLTGLEQIIKNL